MRLPRGDNKTDTVVHLLNACTLAYETLISMRPCGQAELYVENEGGDKVNVLLTLETAIDKATELLDGEKGDYGTN